MVAVKLRRSASITEWVRYYVACTINTLFGYGVYSLLIASHLNIYAAQLIAYVLGVIFNFFMYSNHVFRSRSPSKIRFAVAYGANYLVSVSLLALFSHFLTSPYLMGPLVVVGSSLVNFLVLKHIVFRQQAATT